uniref:tyrosine-type recombinase/integrase n=1 Tax=Serratia marcescens TaxID=615 RepID=UPI0021CC81A8
YVAVTPAGTISFRYNYSINGRQETVTFGRYGVGGITLAEARERLNEAKKMVVGGRSPAREKARDKACIKDAETFGAWAEKWLRGYQMAESTRDMWRSVYQRELKSKFAQQKLTEITHEDLRALTDNIVEREAPATAVHAREIVLQVYRWAIERGQKVDNPADLVRPASIAKFEPRDRALTPVEIGLMYRDAYTAISGAGAMAMGASAQVSGGASALKAAFESAQAAMAEESGSGGGGGSGGGCGGGEDTGSVDTSGGQPSGGYSGSSAGSSSGSASGGSQGFASFSRAGRMASHMRSSMANGAAEYQKMKRSSSSSRAQQTIGGELVTQISKQTATRRDNREHDDFAGDSLSGNNKS